MNICNLLFKQNINNNSKISTENHDFFKKSSFYPQKEKEYFT